MPDYPDEISYLVSWAFQLCGRSGDGMNGPSPLSYQTIESWSRLSGITPSPHEVAGLIALDDAIRAPDETEQAKAVADAPVVEKVWPSKKAVPDGG